MRFLRLLVVALFAVVASFAFQRRAHAFSSGITSSQFSTSGCAGCHSGGSSPSVSITADSTCLLAGQSTTIHVTITPANGGGGGLNLRITGGGGTLSIGGADSSQTQILSGEITHNSPKTASGAAIRFSATFNAPGTAGTTSLGLWGLSGNGNGTTSGDGQQFTTLTITTAVSPVCAVGQDCGNATNACGSSILCGKCTAPQTCGGGGVTNQCGCTPLTKAAACGTSVCGNANDGCGGKLSCGSCASNQTCAAGVCLDNQGTSCTAPSDCASGFCVGGVCCDSACNGECQQCKSGTCGVAPSSTTCGSAASCVGVTFNPGGHCSGTDTTCELSLGAPCPGHLVCASTTSCKTSCTSDSDCVGTTCDVATGTCGGPDAGTIDSGTSDTGSSSGDTGSSSGDTGSSSDTGSSGDAGHPSVAGSATHCSSASECSSGFCVDGVCCDSACTEPCHSCALPSSPGVCTAEPLGVDLDHECGAALTCLGTCNGSGGCTGAGPGTECDRNKCTGPSSGIGAVYCIAAGATCDTSQAVAFDCGAYACDPAFGACKSECASSDDCAAGYSCDTTSKTCAAIPSSGSSGCSCEAAGNSGFAWSGGAIFFGAFLLGLSRRRGSRDRRRSSAPVSAGDAR